MESEKNSGLDFSVALRIVGVIVLVFGASIVIKVVDTAWKLFDDSDSIILPLSEKVETNAALNEFVNRALNSTNKFPLNFSDSEVSPSNLQEQNSVREQGPTTSKESTTKKLNLSYFFAWFLVLTLVGIVARIGIMLITVGGNIAGESYWRKNTGKLLRSLVSEIKASNRKEKLEKALT